MALISTINSYYYEPFAEKTTDYTPPAVEYLQTNNTVIGTSASIFVACTTAQDFYLSSLQVSFMGASNTFYSDLYVGLASIAAHFPTIASTGYAFYSLAFGTPGICCGDTTSTASVSLVHSATITCKFFATGFRKK